MNGQLTPEQKTELEQAANILWGDVHYGRAPLSKPDTVGARQVWEWCQLAAKRQLEPFWRTITELRAGAERIPELEQHLAAATRRSSEQREQHTALRNGLQDLAREWEQLCAQYGPRTPHTTAAFLHAAQRIRALTGINPITEDRPAAVFNNERTS